MQRDKIMNTGNELQPAALKALKRKIAIRITLLLLLLGIFILLPAGTFHYWQAYVYFAVIFGPLIFVVHYFYKKDPKFLERRMRIKEQETEQKKIVFSTAFFYVVGFILPGFDHRFGWSDVPAGIVLTADMLVLLSYIFIVYVFKVNRFASRVIEVEKDQTVISTGPYSVIRHPMYLGTIVMFLSTPVALGSYWAVIPFTVLPVSLAFRILNEEKVLSEQLPGYKEYCTKIRYRLIPFVW